MPIQARLAARYAALAPNMQERMRSLLFGVFIAIASIGALFMGFTHATYVGQISGSILGVEAGFMIGDAMRRYLGMV